MEPVQAPRRRGNPRASTVIVTLIALVVLAILKPWTGSIPRGVGGDPSHLPTGVTVAASPGPTPTPDLERAIVKGFCLEPSGWRLFASERWADRQIRGWKSIEPAAVADGPGDARIPLVPQASRAVLTLGYCAPVEGPDRPPPGPTTTTIYRQVAAPGAGPGAVGWETVDALRIAPSGASSPLGGVWGPPGQPGRGPAASSDPAVGWPGGTYVFDIESRGGAGVTFERWFGVVVEVVAPPPR